MNRVAKRAFEIPSFIVMDVLEKAHELERQGRNIIHLQIGEPDFPTPECICEAAQEAIQRGETHYTHSLGIIELREAICEYYHSKYGVHVSPGQIIVTSGTSPALFMIFSALLEAGVEGLWTPRLDFRLGTSGCQHNCIACGHVCPTAAIRPLALEARMGQGAYADTGPVRIGTAFVDRGRCLPWAMGIPCIVCQENCPVSPKSITTRAVLEPVAGLDRLRVRGVGPEAIQVDLPPTRRPLAVLRWEK